MPPNVFVNAGASFKTELMFFTKGKSAEKTWYYDLSDIKVRNKPPFTLNHFEDFLRILPLADQEKKRFKSWFFDATEKRD